MAARSALAAALAALALAQAPAAASASSAPPPRGRYDTTSRVVAGATNVHVLAHSHDDVGWLKTAQQYFDGAQVIGLEPYPSLSVYYANGAVQFILSSVVAALAENADRRFVVVEQWFFQRWWDAQSDATQATVRALVAGGQLVFANGGLVMHDEACPTFADMLDQTSAGIRWIAQTFGPAALPRVTSQLDPFGHSATQASMLASPAAGYIAQFHARMDYGETGLRHATRTLDFAWAPSASLGLAATTMGALGAFGYSTPDGFCFDIGIECQAESAEIVGGGLNNPVNDDAFRGLSDAVGDNVALFVAKVLSTAADTASSYPRDADGTSHQPWTFGDDFDYQQAQQNFLSMDKLIHYVNLNTSSHKVNMLYSTQADYAAARIASATPLALKTSDAFPYSSSPHEVWSGYFTSRPALKGFVRTSSALFAAARQLQAWAARPADTGRTNPLWLLETGLGVAQHHDAVSGTSKQVVANDYARRLQAGRDAAGSALGGWASALLGLGAAGRAPPAAWAACDLANATICAPTEALGGAAVAIFLYSAQAQARDGATLRVPVRLGAGQASWAVLAADGATPVAAQLVPSSPADQRLRTSYYGAAAANMSYLAFRAPSVPACGYTLIFLQPVASAADAPLTFASELREMSAAAAAASLSNGVVTLGFDAASGLLASFASTAAGVPSAANLSQTFLYYSSSRGDNASSVNSGAYIFRPNSTQTAFPVAEGPVALSLVSGPVVSEAWQTFAPWASQVVRLWAGAVDRFEIEYTAGPLPIELLEGQGRELVSRVAVAGWATAGAFATDSNGREWQRRVRNQRPDYNYSVVEPVAGNFFPVNTAARIADGASGASLTVLTDRTQAGASLADGELELMVHRRLTADDEKGVMEDLNEPGVNGAGLIVRGTHTLLLAAGGGGGGAARAHRAALQDALLPPVLRLAPLPVGQAPAAWVAGVAASASLLAVPLPPNVQLLTLHAWNGTAALLRLAHTFETGEDPALSANATVSLAALFGAASGLRVAAAVEMTLTGGQPLADVVPVTYSIATGGGGGGAAAMEAAQRFEEEAEAAAALVPEEARGAMLAALTTRGRRAVARGLADAPWRPRPRRGVAADASAVAADVTTVTLPVVPPPPQGPGLEVTLSCMQVRTFLVTLA